MKKYYLLFLICIFTQTVFGQTSDLNTDLSKENPFFNELNNHFTDSLVKDLTELVVTAQRSPTNRFFTAEAIDLLTFKHIEKYQSRTTPEALTNINGVLVQKTNHGGGSPFVRGLTGNQTLLLVDGVRLSNATFRYGPNQYLNTIDPLSIARIEVLRGGGSVQYGSDALGGTIQVFTKNPTFSPQNQWFGRILGKAVTQNMEQTGHSEFGFSTPKMAFLGVFSYRNFGDLIGGDTTGKQTPSGYREIAFDAKMCWQVANNSILTVAHQNLRQHHIPIFHKVQLENFSLNEFEPQSRRLTYARFEIENKQRFLKKMYVIASLQQTEEGRDSRKNGSTILRRENDKVRSLGLSFNILSNISKKYIINSGIEIYNDLIKSTRKDIDEKTNISIDKRGLYPNDAQMSNFSAFSLHEYKLGDWQFGWGGRLNGFNIQISDENIGQTILTPSTFVWNVSILRGLTKNINVFLSANSGFRAPNVDDLGTLGIVDFRYETPNFDLKPEKSYNFQLGIKINMPTLRGETYFFRNELRQIIARVKLDTFKIQGYPLYQKENVERGYVQGIETAWHWAISERGSADASIAYAYGQNETTAEPMRRIPPLNARFAFNYDVKRWFSTIEILAANKQARLAQGDKADNRIPIGGTPAWKVVNILGGYRFEKVRINLALQNLLNEDYRIHGSGVNAVGRSVSLSINWIIH